MDKAGNAVSNTYTLNLAFGSGYAVDGAGFFLNNEMDDFSAKPGAPNAFGLIGDEANAIAPRQAASFLHGSNHRHEGRRALSHHRQPRWKHHHYGRACRKS